MKRTVRAILWLLLVPYFAVASLNVAPWAGESRKSANRTNAQLVVSLIIVSFVLFALAWMGHLSEGLPREYPYLFASILMLPVWLFVAGWLRAEREVELSRNYMAMSRSTRLAYGLGSVALIAAGWAVLVAPN